MLPEHTIARAVSLLIPQHLPLVIVFQDPPLEAAAHLLPEDKPELARTLVARVGDDEMRLAPRRDPRGQRACTCDLRIIRMGEDPAYHVELLQIEQELSPASDAAWQQLELAEQRLRGGD